MRTLQVMPFPGSSPVTSTASYSGALRIRYDDPQLPRKATLTAIGIAAAEAEIAKARDLALSA